MKKVKLWIKSGFEFPDSHFTYVEKNYLLHVKMTK